MSNPDDISSSILPDHVDQALEALWHGRSDEFDRLIDEDVEGGVGMGAVFQGIVAGLEDNHPTVPENVANFEVIKELGRGGMGVVYQARQKHPQRDVALKVVRGGCFVDQKRIQLFQREIQSLARLKHRNIAAIYEAGRTKDGQHFFAMELVHGTSLTQYLRSAQSDVSGRACGVVQKLELFVEICEAISYAHQRGVIHRDLKPGNILVTQERSSSESSASRLGGPEIKVLDFGLARITDEDVAVTTITTDTAKIRGTLAYMSPEQASGDPIEVDFRSDVYSLGVILYEMMTGQLPYDVRHRSMADAIRAISEDTPPRPSTMNKALRGDLETIMMKALEKQPEQRYQSASALAEDIRRYLSDQPILAVPPSAAYQLRKLIARHRVPFAAGVVVFFMLVVSVAVSLTFALRESHQRNLAEHRLTSVRAEKKKVEASQSFLRDLMGSASPEEDGRDVKVVDVLARAPEEIERKFGEQPEVAAALYEMIGRTYHDLGAYDKSERLLRMAVDIHTRTLGADHEETVKSMRWVAETLHSSEQFDEAVEYYEKCIAKQVAILGREHDTTLGTLNNYADLLQNIGRVEHAERTFKQVLEARRRVYGEDHKETLAVKNNLGLMYLATNRNAEAEPLVLEAMHGLRKVYGEAHPLSLTAANNAVILFVNQDESDKAESLMRSTITIQISKLGEAHPHTLRSRNNLAWILNKQGEPRAAADEYSAVLEIDRKVNAFGDWMRTTIRGNYGECLMALEQFQEAERHLLASYQGFDSLFGGDDHRTRKGTERLAELYETWGKNNKAAQWRAKLSSPDGASESTSN